MTRRVCVRDVEEPQELDEGDSVGEGDKRPLHLATHVAEEVTEVLQRQTLTRPATPITTQRAPVTGRACMSSVARGGGRTRIGRAPRCGRRPTRCVRGCW